MALPFSLKDRHGCGFILGLLLAVTISIGVLISAADVDRQELGIAIVPFGWHRLIVVHSLSTLCLSWWLARLTRELGSTWWFGLGGCCLNIGLGVVAAAVTLILGQVFAIVLETEQPNYVWRLIGRIVWCLTLQVPWCLLGLIITQMEGKQCRPLFSHGNLLALSLVGAFGVPLSFLQFFLGEQTIFAQNAWSRSRFVDARLVAQRLCDVGSSKSLGERQTEINGVTSTVEVTPARAVSDLRSSCEYAEHQIEMILALPTRDEDRRKLAQYYLALNRFCAAESVLVPLADHDAAAALDLARYLHDRDRPAESRKWAETALRHAWAASAAPMTESFDRDRLKLEAYDWLSMMAGETGDWRAAEQYLLDALKKLPAHRAYIHGRLAKHYDYVGELSKAQMHQARAAAADPQAYPPPESLISKALCYSAPIGLARPKSSQFKK